METVAKTIQSQATAPVNKTCSLKKNVAVTKASCKHGLWRLPRIDYGICRYCSLAMFREVFLWAKLTENPRIKFAQQTLSYVAHNLQYSQLFLHFIRSRNGRCSAWP